MLTLLFNQSVQGTLAATEAQDIAAFVGSGVSGTLATTEATDTAAFAGASGTVVSGILSTTERSDTAAFSGIFFALGVSMTNRFSTPNPQYADATGLPYTGGSLTFYVSGTSTPLATYSNRALNFPNTNPVVLDSAGRAGDIFLQNLAYKVVLEDVNNVVIWTEDPVYASDFSTTAAFLSGAGSPNGVVAGSAGSATVPASAYWDTTNNILYVATTTGTTLTTVWTAVNASTAAAVVPPPQGYLTPTTGVAIIPGDAVSVTSVFYTPYVGNLVPIYNGSSFIPTVFTELTLALNAAHTASNIYDVFVFNNSGVPTVVTGPSWSAGTGGNITAGACARGTGAGGAALSRINGIWTNTVQITGRNGATTYTINANLATYVGSLFIDGTNGQISCYRSYGQSRKWGIWNAYNRVPIIVKAGDSTAGWTLGGGGSSAFQALRNATGNSITIFSGLPELAYDFSSYLRASFTATTSQSAQFYTAIGFNSTTAASGIAGTYAISFGAGVAGNFTFIDSSVGRYAAVPSLGINVVTALEAYAISGAAIPTASSGGESSNLLTATWMG